MHFFNFDHLRITLQSSDLIWDIKFVPPSLPLPPLIFFHFQALIHDLLWWWAYSWLIFSLKWCLWSPFLLFPSSLPFRFHRGIANVVSFFLVLIFRHPNNVNISLTTNSYFSLCLFLSHYIINNLSLFSFSLGFKVYIFFHYFFI